MPSYIKSKERVFNYAEVFTSEEIVNEMLDLVDNQLVRIDSRFLEPACGTGNFLEPVLRRKMLLVKKKYKKIQSEYEQQALLALGSVYGIDILQDNVCECRKRLLDIWINEYRMIFKKCISDEIIKSAEFIISKNIVWGDALTMQTGENEKIIFSEWSIITSGKFQRRDFRYDKLHETGNEEDFSSELLKQYVCDYRRIWEDVN